MLGLPVPQTLIYAGQIMHNEQQLREYGVPPVRQRERCCDLRVLWRCMQSHLYYQPAL